jgi:hypothetical protein
MSQTFTDWRSARAFAIQRARSLHLDMAIRAVKEYGRKAYNVTIACRNDSDYARAEIVTPRDLI